MTAAITSVTAFATTSPLILPISVQLRLPVLIQLQPITVHPITGQSHTEPITTVHPITEQLDCSPTIHPITEQLDLSPINILYNFCAALYQINKYITILHPSNPRFKACCKYNNINLPLFQPPLEYLCDLLESYSTSTRQFRERLRAYNIALAFISVNCTVTDCGVS